MKQKKQESVVNKLKKFNIENLIKFQKSAQKSSASFLVLLERLIKSLKHTVHTHFLEKN